MKKSPKHIIKKAMHEKFALPVGLTTTSGKVTRYTLLQVGHLPFSCIHFSKQLL